MDPTLESCCQREARQQRRQEKVLKELAKHDVSTRAVDIRKSAIGVPPSSTAKHSTDSLSNSPLFEEEDDDECWESDDEEIFREMVTQRLQAAQSTDKPAVEAARLDGFGSLTQVACVNRQGLVAEVRKFERTVCLIEQDFAQTGDTFQRLLAQLAGTFFGTKFLLWKLPNEHVSAAKAFGLSSLPGIVAFKDGQVTGSYTPRNKGSTDYECVVEVKEFLEKLGFCARRPSRCYYEESQGMQLQDVDQCNMKDVDRTGPDSDHDSDEAPKRCSVPGCSKPYAHEHVGSSYSHTKNFCVD